MNSVIKGNLYRCLAIDLTHYDVSWQYLTTKTMMHLPELWQNSKEYLQSILVLVVK